MSDKKPWLVAPEIWKTEASFINWVRGILRRGWKTHPLKLEFIKRNRKRITNPVAANRKRHPECWGMTCEICKRDTVQADIQIDHRGDSGHFTKFSDAEAYMEHLFLIDYDSIRPLCTTCHSIVSHAQNTGMSFDDAKIDKQVIAIMKDKKKALALLQQHGVQCRNDVQRREALTAILKEKA